MQIQFVNIAVSISQQDPINLIVGFVLNDFDF